MNASSFHLPAMFLQPTQYSYLHKLNPFSLLAVLALHLHHLSIYVISTNNRSFLLVCFSSLWNQFPASFHHPCTNLSNSDSPSAMSVTSPLVSSTRHSRHPSPLHSFVPGLKHSFSANPSHHNFPFLLQDWQWISHIVHCLSISVFTFSFYRAMLCIRGTSHGPVSVCLCPSVTSRCFY